MRSRDKGKVRRLERLLPGGLNVSPFFALSLALTACLFLGTPFTSVVQLPENSSMKNRCFASSPLCPPVGEFFSELSLLVCGRRHVSEYRYWFDFSSEIHFLDISVIS